jgi:hypothetical protein
MGVQASTKHGLKSESRKAATSRHGTASQPATRPVGGAFGRAGTDRRTPRSAGALDRRQPPTRSGRLRAVGAVGISNLSPGREAEEQRHVPPRGTRKGGDAGTKRRQQ